MVVIGLLQVKLQVNSATPLMGHHLGYLASHWGVPVTVCKLQYLSEIS